MMIRSWGGKYDHDQTNPYADIIEVRTTPADASEARDRYWQVVQAIGTVAAKQGLMGILLSTHISTAVFDEIDGQFVDFNEDTLGHQIAAAVQHNLTRIQPLQLDSGLEEGISVLEAFPGKEGSTAVYDNRLEFRHPTVGVADPRLDMLAVLDGIRQVSSGVVSREAIRNLHKCKSLGSNSSYKEGMMTLMECCTWDTVSKRLVMPAHFFGDSLNNYESCSLNGLVSALTDGKQKTYIGAGVLQEQVSSFRLNKSGNYIFGGDPKITVILDSDTIRIVPDIRPDSPQIHLDRRRNVGQSSIVRRIMGGIIPRMTSADESVQIRQAMIDRQVVITEPEENLETSI
jgi:hypothetical protein